MQKAIITGASSGIGKELAFIMAEAGHDLVLVSRDKSELNTVKSAITKKYNVAVSINISDLSVPGSAKKLYEATKKEQVEILVNNAGVGLKGDFFHDDVTRTTQLAHLNMVSLMELSQLFGADFVANNSGKILNVGSIVAFFPGPKQPVYYASKSFVRSLSRALAYNLKGTGVSVTALHPGVTKTNFFKAANAKGFNEGASPKSVAELGYRAMMAGKIEVTYGFYNKFLSNVFVRIVPYRLQTYIVDRASEV
ncbi:MAG: SDR family NAD(P)-dependent oxidoreductase [Candidatus Saccharibacteria bacterium]